MPNNLQMIHDGHVIAKDQGSNYYNVDFFIIVLGNEEYVCFPPLKECPHWYFIDPVTFEYHNFEKMADMLDAVCKDARDYAGA